MLTVAAKSAFEEKVTASNQFIKIDPNSDLNDRRLILTFEAKLIDLKVLREIHERQIAIITNA